jgi:hypothetical protein
VRNLHHFSASATKLVQEMLEDYIQQGLEARAFVVLKMLPEEAVPASTPQSHHPFDPET